MLYKRDSLMSLLMTWCGNQIGPLLVDPSHPPIPGSRYLYQNICIKIFVLVEAPSHPPILTSKREVTTVCPLVNR